MHERFDDLRHVHLNSGWTAPIASLECGLTHFSVLEHSSKPRPLMSQFPVGSKIGYQKVKERIVGS